MAEEKKDIELAQRFTPTNFKELDYFAEILTHSDMVPKSHLDGEGRVKKGNIMACVMMGASLGVPPMQAIQNICVINGMPSVWGDLALALVKTHKDCVDIIEERIENGWRCTVKRRGKSDVVREFTTADAKKAHLDTKKGPWAEYPDRMLQMRARGFAIRDQFPDALRGLHIAEEYIEVKAEVVTPSEDPAERLRKAKSSIESGQPIAEPPKEEPGPSAPDSEAEAVLELILSQLRELEFNFSPESLEKLKNLKTEDEIATAIDYYEKKLIEKRQAIEETDQDGE